MEYVRYTQQINPLKYDFNGIEVIIGIKHVLDLK